MRAGIWFVVMETETSESPHELSPKAKRPHPLHTNWIFYGKSLFFLLLYLSIFNPFKIYFTLVKFLNVNMFWNQRSLVYVEEQNSRFSRNQSKCRVA